MKQVSIPDTKANTKQTEQDHSSKMIRKPSMTVYQDIDYFYDLNNGSPWFTFGKEEE